MITEQAKASAIARMHHQVPLEEIAEEMEIPLVLLKEWHSKLDINGMIAINSNSHALSRVLEGEVVGNATELLLKAKLETLAMDIASEASKSIGSGDVVYAKSIELAANTAVKLYQTFIMKGGNAGPPGEGMGNLSNSGFNAFSSLMKD